jgi:hypothetical protein
MTKTREFCAWQSAKQRCSNQHYHNFAHYGGRGITMAEEWRTDFARFYADMGPCPAGHSLDRINNEGNYAPGNCRWADEITQHRNTRRNVMLTLDGKTATITEWAQRIGVRKTTLHERLRRGWSPERALKTPKQRYRRSA